MKKLISLVLTLSMICISLCSCDEQTVLDTLDRIFGENKEDETLELTKYIKDEDASTGVTSTPESVMDFSAKLFYECAEKENTVISPYSVINALGMAQNGADGETLSEFEKLFGIERDTLNEYLEISLTGKGKELVLANSIWIKDDFKERIKESYLTKMKSDFQTEVFAAAFDDTTLSAINTYISEKTNGLIENALDEVDPLSVMFLINTVYFKADWASPYIDSSNVDVFTNIDGTESTAEYLYSNENKYISGNDAQGFIKYYDGEKYAFAAILPDEEVELDDYVGSLTGKSILEMLSDPTDISVHIKMPKFETKYKGEISDALRNMGLEKAFDAKEADFLNMSDAELYISRVLHDAVIKVDEKGTEAAAATILDVRFGAAIEDEKEYKTVHLDRPFMYVIFDTETYAPIFIGQITNM